MDRRKVTSISKTAFFRPAPGRRSLAKSDHGVIEPAKAIAAICEIITQPGLHAKMWRELSASLAISDSEFSAVQDGLALDGVVTGVIVICDLVVPLRSVRLAAAFAVNLAAGLGERP